MVGQQVPVRSGRPLAAVWLGVAVVTGILLAVSRAATGPLDDPDPARQRPGLLDVGELPKPAPPVTEDIPVAGRPAVVFFARPSELEPLCGALADFDPPQPSEVAVVVVGEGGRCPQGIPVVDDREGELAAGYGLPAPRDNGPPVGYAVVDATGDIRYRTLDPNVGSLLGEVSTILRAVS
jgi:hypothetical protein